MTKHKNNSKAAMFGLDARIALAIFGALSVITGAALYSALNKVQTIRYVTDLKELNKAVEQYMLDTGTDLPRKETGDYAYVGKIMELKSSTRSGWKGPYYPKEYTSTLYSFKTDLPFYTTGTSALSVDILDGQAILGGDKTVTKCTSSSEYCYYWARYGAVKNNGIADAIDKFVDGEVNHTEGLVRVYTHPTHGYQHIFLKGPRTLTNTVTVN